MPDNVKIIGLEKVVRNLEGFEADLNTKFGKDARDKSLNELRERGEKYPRKPAGSKYQRTGRYGQSWAEEPQGFLSGRVWNKVRSAKGRFYAPYVGGMDSQASVHQGRWPTTAQIADEKRQKIVGFYQYAVDQATKRANS